MGLQPWIARLLGCALLVGAGLGCGGLSEQEKLELDVRALRDDLADHKQRVSDLELRIKTIRARNRVLISLVQGLTTAPDASPAQGPDRMGRARAALSDLDHDLDELAGALNKSRASFVELRTERDRLETNLGQAVKTIEESQKRADEAEERIDTYKGMLLSLRAMIADSKLNLRVTRNQMVVQLPDALLFDTGEAALKPEGKALLDDVAEVLKAVPGREFQIAGHTDDVPIRSWRFPSNWHLSAARAVDVTRYLVERGVPKDRISGAAYADTRPLQTSTTPEARKANRRIEIVLLPNLSELPDLSELDAIELEQPSASVATEPGPAAQPSPEGASTPVSNDHASPASQPAQELEQ